MKTKNRRPGFKEFDADLIEAAQKQRMQEFRNQREAEDFLRNAQGYLAHALKSVIDNEFKAAHHSMARVKECLSEASRFLRRKPV